MFRAGRIELHYAGLMTAPQISLAGHDDGQKPVAICPEWGEYYVNHGGRQPIPPLVKRRNLSRRMDGISSKERTKLHKQVMGLSLDELLLHYFYAIAVFRRNGTAVPTFFDHFPAMRNSSINGPNNASYSGIAFFKTMLKYGMSASFTTRLAEQDNACKS
jgi:hypothetical protein